jgi:hypothetical protein
LIFFVLLAHQGKLSGHWHFQVQPMNDGGITYDKSILRHGSTIKNRRIEQKMGAFHSFAIISSANNSGELWQTDGTSEGTVMKSLGRMKILIGIF